MAKTAVGLDMDELGTLNRGGCGHVTRKLHAALRPCQVSCVSATPTLLTDGRSRAAYAEGAGIYRIVPRAVAIPKTVEDVQQLLRWAAATGTSLVPRGAGSGMPGGSVGHGV